MVQRVDYRGWKDICEVMGLQDKRTAKKKLKQMGLLCYDDGRPVLSIDDYREACKVRAIKK